MKTELAAVFDPVPPGGVERAATFVLRLPDVLGVPVIIDAAWNSKRPALVAVIRCEAVSSDARWRFAFWCAQLGARAATITMFNDVQRRELNNILAGCPAKSAHIEPKQLFSSLKKLLGDAGGALSARSQLELELEPAVGGVTVLLDRGAISLHVPCVHAPPMNDRLRLAVKIGERRQHCDGVVTSVVRPANAHAMRAPGFVVSLELPAPSLAALQRAAVVEPKVEARHGSPADPRRAGERYSFQAPVHVEAAEALAPVPRTPPPKSATSPGAAEVLPEPALAARPAREPREAPATLAPAILAYDTEQDLVDDYVENLSKGGAFIKTATPAPLDTMVRLRVELPRGGVLATDAKVVWIGNGGMGVQFQLDVHAREKLDAILERISAPPRSALVIVGDPVLAAEASIGLAAASFNVIRADGRADGLSKLFDELLSLNVLVVDVATAEGRSIVDMVRDAGESELPIVAVGGEMSRATRSVAASSGAQAIVAACLEVAKKT